MSERGLNWSLRSKSGSSSSVPAWTSMGRTVAFKQITPFLSRFLLVVVISTATESTLAPCTIGTPLLLTLF